MAPAVIDKQCLHLGHTREALWVSIFHSHHPMMYGMAGGMGKLNTPKERET